jgi:hypothetical protein
MLIAKLTAFLGSALFLGGATGTLPPTSLAIGAVLLLVAAATGAVVLEGRDLELVAGLVAHPVEDATQPSSTTATLDEPMQPVA